MMRTRFAFLTVLIVANLAPSAQVRKWVDSTGTYSVEAELVEFSDGEVRLRTDDGTMISVPVTRLSAADQEYVRHSRVEETVAEQPSQAQATASASAESSGNESTAAEPATDEPENRPSSNDTQSIPDTRGGFSGFIAWLLWQVYVYFPFEGTWDWLVLFVFLAAVTRSLAMPTSWKLGKWASGKGAASGSEGCAIHLHNLFTQTGVMFLFLWFFSTDAGHTFLKGRTWFGGVPVLDSNSPLWLSAVLLFVAGAAFWASSITLGWALALPVDDPAFATSGTFATCSALHLFVVLGAHLFYWYWSTPSLVLMWVFTVVDGLALNGLALYLSVAYHFKQRRG